jgi:hypothetical protein
MDTLDEMQLPECNQKRLLSQMMLNQLEIELKSTIENFQNQNNYSFKPYELDFMLLSIIKSHHESYIMMKFGEKTISKTNK